MSAFLHSMAGRVFVILVGGILASAALTLHLANRERHAIVDHLRTNHASERIVQIVTMLEASPSASWAQTLAALSRDGLVAEIAPAPNSAGVPDPALAARLRQRLGDGYRVTAMQVACAPRIDSVASAPLCRAADIRLPDARVLHLALPPHLDRSPLQTMPHLLLYGLLFAALLVLLAFAVTRMATRPLRLLAAAATGLGNNIESPPLAEAGPTEVREAAAAFNGMQAQVRNFIQERTQMLSAITHDLQTPLTRLRLRLEKVPDEELRNKLTGDMSAMQDMIRDGLDLARSLHSGEAMQRIDFNSLMHSVCDDAIEAGQDVSLEGAAGEGAGGAAINAAPRAIRRCLTNVLDNAVHYGGYARIQVKRGTEYLIVRIRDGGPGIPEAQLEQVFAPFFRLEGSRSRETGGTGIGLAIARNIAEQHGGSLVLHNHPRGGVEAVLELPLA